MKKIIIGFIFLLISNASFAKEDALQLQKKWDHIHYEIKDLGDQKKAMQELSQLALYEVRQNPNSAEVKGWAGIILSSEAGYYRINVVKALGLAKKARTLLEEAVDMNPKALNGSIYATLGSLYSEVPPFPIGFGNQDKAQDYFNKALTINQDDIENNFFYAQFLFNKKEYKKALKYFQKAKNAPLRTDRSVADEGRRREVDIWIGKTQSKIS